MVRFFFLVEFEVFESEEECKEQLNGNSSLGNFFDTIDDLCIRGSHVVRASLVEVRSSALSLLRKRARKTTRLCKGLN